MWEVSHVVYAHELLGYGVHVDVAEVVIGQVLMEVGVRFVFVGVES